MSTFKITLRATADRGISDQTVAKETIQSEFLSRGDDALEASKTATELFRAVYAGHDTSLMDFKITAILVEPYNEDLERVYMEGER